MHTSSTFDIRESVTKANFLRLIIGFPISIGLIIWGWHYMPKELPALLNENEIDEAINLVNGWVVFGFFLLMTGIPTLIREIVFLVRSVGTWGEWHFRLTPDELIWDVPDHAHGDETGFRTKLSDVKEIECRTIKEYEEPTKQEYWIHFHNRDSIQLHAYAGITLSWLVSRICAQGVEFNETNIR